MILGVHIKSEGYPNVTYRVRDLAKHPRLAVTELNFPLDAGQAIFSASKQQGRYLQSARRLLQFLSAHVKALAGYLTHGRPVRVYVPYPAVFVLLGFALLPSRWRPKVTIADCFISLHDTAVNDRGLLPATGTRARLLRRLESTACRMATWVIVDTDLNARHMVRELALDPSRVIALPLSIDEQTYEHRVYECTRHRCTVLFIGTFVPLQGVDVIARAARLLRHRHDIRIRLIGSGQCANQVRDILALDPGANVEWVTQWMDGCELAREIRDADICLGIFGTGEKTRRVWPLKNYSYMSVGRALITGDTPCARHLGGLAEEAPFLVVPTGDPAALADAISTLADDPQRRRALAAASRRFFEAHLSARRAIPEIVDRLLSA